MKWRTSFALGTALLMGTTLMSPLSRAKGVKPHPTAPSSFAGLVQPLIPSVVNISTTTQTKARGDFSAGPEMPMPKGSPFEELFKDYFDRMQPEGPRQSTSLGSGFIIDSAGYIVTNYHVVAEADQINVILDDNTELKATLVGRDRRTDIAVLKVQTDKKLTAVNWTQKDDLRVGDWIIAIGNPFGLGSTVTSGIVSHLARDIADRPGQPTSSDFVDGYIQTDASINLGNSGGPMFDMTGKVVGVNSAIYSPTGGNVGIGFAIPASLAQKVVDQILKYGRTRRGWLGVRIFQVVTADIAEGLGLQKPEGALVGSVVPKGPAAKANLQAGDVILQVNGADVKEARNLPRLVGNLPVGKEVPLTVWRKGKTIKLNVHIGEYEEAEETGVIPSPEGGKSLTKGVTVQGMTLQPLTNEARKRLDLDTKSHGVLVVDVDADSIAADKGLRAGDIIVEISQEDVKTPQDVIEKMKAADKAGRRTVLLLVNRDGEVRYVSIRLADEQKRT